MSTFRKVRWERIGAVAVILTVVVLVGYKWLSSDSDGIQVGKNYQLAYSFLTDIKTSQGTIPGRQFDFADRNLPRTSIIVPVRDERGIVIARENYDLPPSTIRKVQGHIPAKTIEGVTYPAYDYTAWEYHFSVKAPQEIIPTVTPHR